MKKTFGGTRSIALGGEYYLRTAGVSGEIEVWDRWSSHSTRGGDAATDLFTVPLERSEFIIVKTLALRVTTAEPTARSDVRSGAADSPFLEVLAPDLGPKSGQVVFMQDEDGAVSWHFPLATTGDIQPTSTMGTAKRFLLPTPAATAPESETRGITGFVGRAILKFLIFPISDKLLNDRIADYVEEWETAHRPYRARWFDPARYHQRATEALAVDDWKRLASGTALLFIHGTLSTSYDAFHDLDSATLATLTERYGGRVFAFDHHTLSHSPQENARRLLGLIPNEASLAVDIVCHSRGGLVARCLAEQGDEAKLQVGRVVFVAATNAGTILADPKHLIAFIDRWSTLLNLFPMASADEIVDAILILVKVVAHSGLRALEGLACMKPGGDFLAALNQGGRASDGYFALSADYTPAHPALRGVTRRVGNVLFDNLFGGVPNDLVVPTWGVFDENGMARFPIPEHRRHVYSPEDGISHTGFFGAAGTGPRLLEWLCPDV